MKSYKITVQINGIDTEIELTEGQVASIEAQSKPKKFEIQYEAGCTFFINSTGLHGRQYGDDITCLYHGRYRKTKESAELSLARNKRANRLEALVDQLDGMKEFVYGEKNWYIRYSKEKWLINYDATLYHPGKIYMTQKCAIRVCESDGISDANQREYCNAKGRRYW